MAYENTRRDRVSELESGRRGARERHISYLRHDLEMVGRERLEKSVGACCRDDCGCVCVGRHHHDLVKAHHLAFVTENLLHVSSKQLSVGRVRGLGVSVQQTDAGLVASVL